MNYDDLHVTPKPVTDRDRFLALLADFSIIGSEGLVHGTTYNVVLTPESGGVVGHEWLANVWSFDENGKFTSVAVWE